MPDSACTFTGPRGTAADLPKRAPAPTLSDLARAPGPGERLTERPRRTSPRAATASVLLDASRPRAWAAGATPATWAPLLTERAKAIFFLFREK